MGNEFSDLCDMGNEDLEVKCRYHDQVNVYFCVEHCLVLCPDCVSISEHCRYCWLERVEPKYGHHVSDESSFVLFRHLRSCHSHGAPKEYFCTKHQEAVCSSCYHRWAPNHEGCETIKCMGYRRADELENTDEENLKKFKEYFAEENVAKESVESIESRRVYPQICPRDRRVVHLWNHLDDPYGMCVCITVFSVLLILLVHVCFCFQIELFSSKNFRQARLKLRI